MEEDRVMKTLLLVFIPALLFTSGVSFAEDILARPACNFELLPVEIGSINVEKIGTVFYLDEENMDHFAANYLAIRQCMTDLEMWAILVERATKEDMVPAGPIGTGKLLERSNANFSNELQEVESDGVTFYILGGKQYGPD
jgi:hypothetical protein